MGSFIVNLHVRDANPDAVRTAMVTLGGKHHVTDSVAHWVSVYEQRMSKQDEGWIRSLSQHLSNQLAAPVVALMVHDSDIFCYWLFDRGNLLDQFNSWPQYFGGGGRRPSGGDPTALLPYCRPQTTRASLEATLTEEPIFAEDQLGKLADALGIPPRHAHGDFHHLDELREPKNGVGEKRFGKKLEVWKGADPDPSCETLVEAAGDGDLETVNAQLDQGVDIDGIALFVLPPIVGAGRTKVQFRPLHAAILLGRIDVVDVLLDRGAGLATTIPPYGDTPLHLAASRAQPEIVKRLLDRGASPSVRRSQDGATPLHVAEQTEKRAAHFAEHISAIRAMGGPAGLIPDLDAAVRCVALLRAVSR